MSEPRKHHYVPQSYLKSFAFGKVKNPQIYVLSKRPYKIYTASVENSAVERDFYTVDSLQDKYAWEKHYAKCIEPILSAIIKKIRQRCENMLIQDRAIVLNEDEKFELALSIVFQLLRGTHTREYEQKLYNKLLPKISEQTRMHFGTLTQEQENLILSFASENKYFKEIAMKTIFRKDSIEKFVTILMQRDFVIYKIVGEPSFVTSDNPIVLIDVVSHDATPFKNGLANAKTLLYYPISPKILLGAYHPDLFLGTLGSENCRIKMLDGKNELKFIYAQNQKQKGHSSNYVYAQSKKELEPL